MSVTMTSLLRRMEVVVRFNFAARNDSAYGRELARASIKLLRKLRAA